MQAALGVGILWDPALHWHVLGTWDQRGPKVCPVPISNAGIAGEWHPKAVKWNEYLETGSSLAFLPPLTTFLLLTQTIFVFYFLKYIYLYI